MYINVSRKTIYAGDIFIVMLEKGEVMCFFSL